MPFEGPMPQTCFVFTKAIDLGFENPVVELTR
jgi:predicted membrane GTPase involved in stress response